MKASTQIWLAAALIQQERGPDADFPVEEVVSRASAEAWNGVRLSTLRTHASSHCVASLPPNPGKYRMLTRTGHGRVRLFRRGDPYHPGREHGPIAPASVDVPSGLRNLLSWYAIDFDRSDGRDPGRELLAWSQAQGVFRGVHADAYVQELRERWE